MSVTSTAAFTTATGNGAATAFPFTFACKSEADVAVYVNDQAQVAGFTVTLNADFIGGTVTFSTAPASGAAVLIASEPPFVQDISFENAGSYNPETVDDLADKSAIRDIALLRDVSRALKLPLGETAATLPSRAELVGKFLVGNADGDLVPSAGTGGGDSALRTDLAGSAGSSLIAFLALGTGAVGRSVQDKLRDVVSPMDYGATGDGVADDKTPILNAMASGKVVDLGGRTYGVNGILAPLSLHGLVNGKLKQLNPTLANVNTLYVLGNTDFVLRDLTVDRGGSAGYTVGTLTKGIYSGIWIENCSRFVLDNVLVTNGGRGTGIGFWNCSIFSVRDCEVTEHYWQEVNPAAPVITDDILQTFWTVFCTDFVMSGCKVLNCTSGAPGNPATNVAADQVSHYTRTPFGGCSRFAVVGCTVDNLDQGFDFTGTDGNHDFTVTACVARNCGTNGFKHADSGFNISYNGCIAIDCGQTGFLSSGRTEVANPDSKNINYDNCFAVNCGSNKAYGAVAGRGFANEAEAFDVTSPRGVAYNGCRVIDNQGLALTAAPSASATSATLTAAFSGTTGTYAAAFASNETKSVTLTNGSTAVTWSGGLAGDSGTAFLYLPTTAYGFRNSVAPPSPPDPMAGRPYSVSCHNCVVDVPGIVSTNRFSGIDHPYAVAPGTVGHTDACATGVWTTLLLDGTEFDDPSAMHNPASNPERFTVKESGLYLIKAKTAFPTSSGGTKRGLQILVNGASVEDATYVAPHATQKTYISDTFIRWIYGGDYVQMQGYQDSGGSLSVDRGDSLLALARVF